MKDMLAMANRGDLSSGQRARLVTDAALTRMARSSAEVRKQIAAFAEEVQRGFRDSCRSECCRTRHQHDGCQTACYC